MPEYLSVNGYVQDLDESSTTQNYELGGMFRDMNGDPYEYVFFSVAISQGFTVQLQSAVNKADGVTPVRTVIKVPIGSTTVTRGATVTDNADQSYGFIKRDGILSVYNSGTLGGALVPSSAVAGTLMAAASSVINLVCAHSIETATGGCSPVDLKCM